MIGLNAVKKTIRCISMTREKSQEMLHVIKDQIESHIGKYAVLKEKDGRNINVFFIKILNPCEGEYSCYDSRGNLRCFIRKHIDFTKILVDDQRLVFLDL